MLDATHCIRSLYTVWSFWTRPIPTVWACPIQQLTSVHCRFIWAWWAPSASSPLVEASSHIRREPYHQFLVCSSCHVGRDKSHQYPIDSFGYVGCERSHQLHVKSYGYVGCDKYNQFPEESSGHVGYDKLH